MNYQFSLHALQYIGDSCCWCLSVFLEIFSDSCREEYCGQPLIYKKEFIENIRFRRWSQFVNDVRTLAFNGILDLKVNSRNEVEVILLCLKKEEIEDFGEEKSL